MAAYGALISLSHTLHHTLHPPPLHKIIIPKEQIELLRGKVNFLIEFLETYPSRRSDEIEDLLMRITDTAYAAQDIIESDVLSQIPREVTSDLRRQRIKLKGLREFGSMVTIKFGQNKYKSEIQKMIKEFHSIEKELMKIKDKKGVDEHLLPKNSTSSRPLPSGNNAMVGFDQRMIELMGALATDESNRQIIPIVGMGGIGKTTLATAIYDNPFIVEHFQVRAWVTISQEYTVRDLLLRLLSEITKADQNKPESTDDEIGELLYKELFDRKYLIVMDDMWDIQVWDNIKRFLLCNNNGSRILVTTRLSKLTVDFESCTPYQMDFLDEGESWDLLRKKVFTDEDCPVELEEIGKDIAKRCNGLPLALVVIGGLLAKSEWTSEHWESIAGDITSALNYGNDECLMKILSLSYIHLPLYLKPCFLYLAMFPEDSKIRASTLVRLWIAEELIKPTQGKCLEEVAYEYLEDLISRNLILVHNKGSRGKVKCCKIHDLLRDLCIIQAEKEKFVFIVNLDDPNLSRNVKAKQRLSISSPSKLVELAETEALRSAIFNRSWLSHGKWFIPDRSVKKLEEKIHGCTLLKVVHYANDNLGIGISISMLSNLRYVVTGSVRSLQSMSLCWNLQTLVFDNGVETLPAEIWQMPQLRHLKIPGTTLPNPPDDQKVIVLENLQTLQAIKHFKCTEQISTRIPNLKKLEVIYYFGSAVAYEQVGNYCLKNLACFKKLESLGVNYGEKLWRDIAFPISLKKLSLWESKIPWEQLSIVGTLPNLEVLKLRKDATKGKEWNPIEGEFLRLKFLFIRECGLEIWGAENYHFPCLECLRLDMVRLEKIPMSFAEIFTLQAIELYWVYDSTWTSAREISEQREQLGYEPLQLREFPRWIMRNIF